MSKCIFVNLSLFTRCTIYIYIYIYIYRRELGAAFILAKVRGVQADHVWSNKHFPAVLLLILVNKAILSTKASHFSVPALGSSLTMAQFSINLVGGRQGLKRNNLKVTAWNSVAECSAQPCGWIHPRPLLVLICYMASVIWGTYPIRWCQCKSILACVNLCELIVTVSL